jgi:hypothetical protein
MELVFVPGSARTAAVHLEWVSRDGDELTSSAQRPYEIFESRSGAHGSDPDDWFTAQGEGWNAYS